MLRSTVWQRFEDISEEPIGSILYNLAVQLDCKEEVDTFHTGGEMGGYWLSGEVEEPVCLLGVKLPVTRCVKFILQHIHLI
jgi:hypothetical protein